MVCIRLVTYDCISHLWAIVVPLPDILFINMALCINIGSADYVSRYTVSDVDTLFSDLNVIASACNGAAGIELSVERVPGKVTSNAFLASHIGQVRAMIKFVRENEKKDVMILASSILSKMAA